MSEHAPDSPAPLWTAEDAAAATGGRLTGAAGWRAAGVNFDSRLIAPGDLFVALRGEAADGHDYIAHALKAGAVAAIADHRPESLSDEAALLECGETLEALRALGRAARARATQAGVAAITGSVGKTSTKDMLAHALLASGKTHAAAKSFNNHIGVPLTLARMPADARFAVYEIGMNAPGEIAPLARLVRPQVAVITAVAAVHTEAFADGVEGVAREKGAIFEGLEPGGIAVLDRGSPHFDQLAGLARARGAEIREFGEGAAHAALIDAQIGEARTRVSARLSGKPMTFEIGAPGRHFARNALAVILAAEALGVPAEAAAARLAGWSALAGRGARSRRTAPGGAVLLVDESYNANPASMAAALETFASAPVGRDAAGAPGRRIAFLTDMLELGPEAAAHHAALAKTSGLERIDEVCCAGKLMAALHEALPEARRGALFADAETMARAAPGRIRAGDAVLVKGSLGSKAAAVAKAIAEAFPEAGD